MWLPWRKPAAVFLSEKRLLVEGLGDTFEEIVTESPVEALSRIIDRANGYRTRIYLGAGLVRLTSVPRVAKLRTRAESEKAAATLAQLPLNEWHVTVVDPSTDSAWLIYAMQRPVYEGLAELRSRQDGRVHSVQPYSAVVFESLLANGFEDAMVGIFEVDSGQLSWLVASDRKVKAAGQVSGIAHELLASEMTRLALASGVAQGNVRLMTFDLSSVAQAETPKGVGRKPVAFDRLLWPVLTA